MRAHLDWTYDSDGKFAGLPDVVKDLHDHGQHYIMIVVRHANTDTGFYCLESIHIYIEEWLCFYANTELLILKYTFKYI